MEVASRFGALLAVLVVGAGLRASGVLDDARTARLNDVAYYGALPALVFGSTYDRSLGGLLSIDLVAGLLVVLFATVAAAWIVHRNRAGRGRRSVAIVQSYHSNLGYLGVPLVAATYDTDVAAVASVILGFVSLFQTPLTIVVLSARNGIDAALPRELRGLATNPVLLSLLAGIAVGAADVPVPSTVDAALGAAGALALPIALLCVGASLDVDLPTVDLRATGTVLALKLCWMPTLAWVVFSRLDVDAETFTASVVMLGMPTAVSTFVFADELGGDETFASLNVFVTTLASVVTLLVLIAALG